MQSVRPETAKIASVSAVIVVAGYSIILLSNGTSLSTVFASATKVGSLFTALGFYWSFFNKVGWKYRVFNLWGWLCSMPDLNGRWEGTICRHRDDQPHPFVLEVTQTYSSLTYRSYTSHSRGESTVCAIFVDEGGAFFVANIWRTMSRRLDDRNVEEPFEGTSLWHVSIDSTGKTIEDNYYTRREPQTKGSLKLKWVSATRKHRFE